MNQRFLKRLQQGRCIRTLKVELGKRSYPIHIGRGLLANGGLWLEHLTGPQVMVVTNEVLAPIYLEPVTRALASRELDVASVTLPDGEQHKTLGSFEHIIDALMTRGFGRDCTVIALGGGVIGDVAGFAAASYQRGVSLIQIPTTLLAQVDSAVGGKTGVNHPKGKNMIGAFHQPRCVIADLDVLDTLGEREYRAGLAEIIKYALIADREFLAWLEQHMDELLAREPQALTHAIEVSCQTKADIVAADERESGQRALLNLGHTFGHAIETATGYGNWLHGEAVAAGMHMAADLSQRLGLISPADVNRVRQLLEAARLPTTAPADMDSATFLQLMASDKKVLNKKLRLVIMAKLGQALLRDDIPSQTLQATLDHFCAGAR